MASKLYPVRIHINGHLVERQVEARLLLVDFIRDHAGLTGTHVGCDTSQCGCCVVHIDGIAAKSCTVLAVQTDGEQVSTIEGLAGPDDALHPMQQAFRDEHALQCGFCTPGMVMTAVDFANRAGASPGEAAIREALAGNLCRCTGYQNIVKAVQAGAERMAAKR